MPDDTEQRRALRERHERKEDGPWQVQFLRSIADKTLFGLFAALVSYICWRALDMRTDELIDCLATPGILNP